MSSPYASPVVLHGEEPSVARLEEMTGDLFHVIGRETGTLIPECIRVYVKEAMAEHLLQESRMRSPSLAPNIPVYIKWGCGYHAEG